jgi:hypothetical protein
MKTILPRLRPKATPAFSVVVSSARNKGGHRVVVRVTAKARVTNPALILPVMTTPVEKISTAPH